jgi:molybdopterin synthase sulfur carrier subunit
MIRVVLPAHLRTLARVQGEVRLQVESPVTLRRRPFVRFFACEQDMSHEPPDTPLPAAVATGAEPFLVVGAMAGG